MGLIALRDELVEQGVDELDILQDTGISPSWFKTHSPSLSHDQRVTVIRNAQRLSKNPETALRAGRRQHINDFGVYGYAMISSATFGDAVDFCFMHRELAGAVLRISRERRENIVIFKSHHPQALGSLLPFVTEFWRSTITSLFSHILGRPFVTKEMYFPYPKPTHVDFYREVFDCPMHFGSDKMEWHLDADMLGEPCPNANELTAKLCSSFCERIVTGAKGESHLQREIRLILLGHPGRFPTLIEVAHQLGMSRRTLFRRLKDEGANYQSLLDNVRQSIAIEYLGGTHIPVEEISNRVGFSDCSNFRKAFKRWTGQTPSAFRT